MKGISRKHEKGIQNFIQNVCRERKSFLEMRIQMEGMMLELL
jgi:hypothetical protein